MSIIVIDDGGLGLLEAIYAQYNALQADVAALQAVFNTHTHTIPAVTYAQNTPTSVSVEQDAALTSQNIIKTI